jgi:hypothetical protein
MIHSNPTQNQRILDYIAKNGSITQLEALTECSVMRLASRVSDLRRNGYPITSKMVKVENRYGETCHIKQYSFGDVNR